MRSARVLIEKCRQPRIFDQCVRQACVFSDLAQKRAHAYQAGDKIAVIHARYKSGAFDASVRAIPIKQIPLPLFQPRYRFQLLLYPLSRAATIGKSAFAGAHVRKQRHAHVGGRCHVCRSLFRIKGVIIRDISAFFTHINKISIGIGGARTQKDQLFLGEPFFLYFFAAKDEQACIRGACRRINGGRKRYASKRRYCRAQ